MTIKPAPAKMIDPSQTDESGTPHAVPEASSLTVARGPVPAPPLAQSVPFAGQRDNGSNQNQQQLSPDQFRKQLSPAGDVAPAEAAGAGEAAVGGEAAAGAGAEAAAGIGGADLLALAAL